MDELNLPKDDNKDLEPKFIPELQPDDLWDETEDSDIDTHAEWLAQADASGHKAGFVNIIGQPNVGKSTLMNALVGERMSIITNKPQTTRHRIIGILSEDNYQVVFSDTPGYIEEPHYKMQERMNNFVDTSFQDGDLLLLVIDTTEPFEQYSQALLKKLQQTNTPIYLLLNKADLRTVEQLEELKAKWMAFYEFDKVYFISALHKQNTETLLADIIAEMPAHPAFYPKDQFTDRPERFFVSEIIREKILELYHQEIPYSCEVMVHTFKEDEEKNLVRIYAYILASRQSQKHILIGKGGKAIKQLGISARESIETFLEKKVFLELIVKIRENWRDDEISLRNFGYDE